MAPQIVENLRLAHERNAARFRAVRSGLYVPKVYHFRPGDHVFVLHHEDTIPGGAFGIRARNEVLKVTRVNPSGTLDLVNQAGVKFTRHVEQCAPCAIPNIDGTVHAHLHKPSAMHPCTHCGDHRQADVMLLCDACNAGWHIHCLPVPLAAVPDDPIWICPDCQKAGFTVEAIAADRARYVPAPQAARPNIELPSPARLRKAQRVADTWHGQVVEHYQGGKRRVGRLVFTDVRDSNWIRIFWTDGTSETFTTRILPRLGVIAENEAPDDLLPKPDPIRVFAAVGRSNQWSICMVDDLKERYSSALPGIHDHHLVKHIHRMISSRARRKTLTMQTRAAEVTLLTEALDFSMCSRVLDPWGDNKAVAAGFRCPGATLVVNDVFGTRPGVDLAMEPLESRLYQDVISKMAGLEAVVMIPPVLLADLALVTALEFATHTVCMLVPRYWEEERTLPREQLLTALKEEQRIVFLHQVAPSPDMCWVCVFASPAHKAAMMRAPHHPDFVEMWLEPLSSSS